MVLVLIRSLQHIKELGLVIDANFLRDMYPQFCQSRVDVQGYIKRVLDLNKKVVAEPKREFTLTNATAVPAILYLDMKEVALALGFPANYWIELYLTNFITSERRVAIFPNETRISSFDKSLEQKIVGEIKSIPEESEAFQTIGRCGWQVPQL